MEKILFIALGGAIGSCARYLVSLGAQRFVGSTDVFPLGTLVVNVLGCFALGLLAATFDHTHRLSESVRIGLMVGVLGGFTTFSTFAMETVDLASEGELGRAGLNIILSNVLGVGAALLGYRLAMRMIGAD